MESICRLFTNARIFDGSGRAPFSGEVLVEKNRIEAVSDSASRISRPDAEVVDCGGRTLMPGPGRGARTSFVAVLCRKDHQ